MARVTPRTHDIGLNTTQNEANYNMWMIQSKLCIGVFFCLYFMVIIAYRPMIYWAIFKLMLDHLLAPPVQIGSCNSADPRPVPISFPEFSVEAQLLEATRHQRTNGCTHRRKDMDMPTCIVCLISHAQGSNTIDSTREASLFRRSHGPDKATVHQSSFFLPKAAYFLTSWLCL